MLAWQWLELAELKGLRQGFVAPPQVRERVEGIIAQVRAKGDGAIRALTLELDGVALEGLRVEDDEISLAYNELDPQLRLTLETAARRIEAYQRRLLGRSTFFPEDNGVILGEVVRPLAVAGLYIPGGRWPLPSTVLMTAIPAGVAGVGRIVLATPPRKDGTVNPVILAAAKIAGVHDVYRVGGAQAIAALAWGTETIPKVDKVAGPGNVYVTTAKQLVFGQVGIDLLAGPSEVGILADETANADFLAADLLAQGEHDPLSAAYLITPSRELGEAVAAKLVMAAEKLPFPLGGGMILVENLEEGVQVLNQLAPEHSGLCLSDPWSFLGKVRAAGSIFLGHGSPEGFGDYIAGPSHVLPTGGTARFASPLSSRDFQVSSSVLFCPPRGGGELLGAARNLAEAEGLVHHARALKLREGGGAA